MDALDMIEFGNADIEQAVTSLTKRRTVLHPAAQRYAEHAVRSYAEHPSSMSERMSPARWWWVAQRDSPNALWEMWAWGRRYESVATGGRELRLLRMGSVAGRSDDDDLAATAMAAYVVAFGAAGKWPRPWSEPFELGLCDGVEHVRVVEVGLFDGSVRILFDGTPEQAQRLYVQHGRDVVAELARRDDPQPGWACGKCKVMDRCDALARIPGLLGVDARSTPIRTTSISDLRYYRTCPAQSYMYSVHLPRISEYSTEAALGQGVHRWLEDIHASDHPACTPERMPSGREPWTAGEWEIAGEEAAIGASMLSNHIDVCPFSVDAPITEIRTEPTLSFFDPAAQAVVIAKPDLLYRENGGWVWHETKTTQRTPRGVGDELLDKYPQLALAVVVLGAGALGGRDDTSRVELELLHPGGAELHLIDPTDPARVAYARQVLRELATPWRLDDAFEPRPGKACQWCPVSKWCPSSAAPQSE
ncbi:PD-(D/E)XK nuclease family protein [Nocardia sp. NPDC057440]|uniref:PD-(D/E)XK nuclease family protein n=1 Tax=Nocardia sp. NPDC057440 TaxID=3346134 RepID=UPI003672061E